jgi:hypothetical protein
MSAFATAAEHAQRGQELRALHSVHSAGGPPAAAAPAGATAQVRMPLALVCGSHGGSVEPCLVLQLWARRIWSLEAGDGPLSVDTWWYWQAATCYKLPCLGCICRQACSTPNYFYKRL